MIQALSTKLNAKTFFYIFTILYPISYFLPAYVMPAFFQITIKEHLGLPQDIPALLIGYKCAWGAIITMFKSPVAFLGTLANFAVFSIFFLQMTPIGSNFKLLKSILGVLIMVSVLIWPVALRIGFLPGYYLWATACIGIGFSYSAMKPYKTRFEDLVLDEDFKEKED